MNNFLKVTLLVILVTFFTNSSVMAGTFWKPPYGKQILSIEDPGRPYEIISLVFSYQQFAKFGFEDPLIAAIKSGYSDLIKDIKRAKADAIIGLRIEFNSRPMKGEEGRVLLYGTLIKYK